MQFFKVLNYSLKTCNILDKIENVITKTIPDNKTPGEGLLLQCLQGETEGKRGNLRVEEGENGEAHQKGKGKRVE